MFSHIPPILCSIIIGIIPLFLFNIPFLSESTQLLNLLLCFASGSLLTDAINHIYSHGHHGHDHHNHNHSSTLHSHSHQTGDYLLLGIFVFFILDRLAKILQTHSHHHGQHDHPTHNLMKSKKSQSRKSSISDSNQNASLDHDHGHSHGNGHDHDHNHNVGIGSGGYLSLIADAIHNFTDGIAIASSFKNGLSSGLTTSFAIFVHEIPHNIGDYALMLKAGFNLNMIKTLQFMTGMATVIGTLIGKILLDDCEWLMEFSTGGFLYLALFTILGEVRHHHHYSMLSLVLECMSFGMGIVIMLFIDGLL